MQEKQNNLFNHLSNHLKSTIAKALTAGAALQNEYVQPIHLVFALLKEEGCIAREILMKANVQISQLEQALAEEPMLDAGQSLNANGTPTISAVVPHLAETSKQALEKAMLLAYEHEHKFVGTEHLLYGLLQIEDGRTEEILRESNADKSTMLDQINTVLSSTSNFPDMDDVDAVLDDLEDIRAQVQEMEQAEKKAGMSMPPAKTEKTRLFKKKKKDKATALDVFAIELTRPARQEHIDPVIGRQKEIERVIHVLSRRNKNNPVLVGEPGVGKTAIAEGLAKRIVEGKVPAMLKRKRIYSLDLALLLSGAIYRGEFEARLKQIIEEVADDPEVILFIDELHNIIGAGSNQGTMDAANILKPALARGSIRCIGATTIDEFKKHISGDPALERRFQSIRVEEPTLKDTEHILKGLKKYYESFHKVTIDPEAIGAAVRLSEKYIHDQFLPDKAIDLIDEAAAAVRVRQAPSKQDEERFALEQALTSCEEDKEKAIHEEAFEKAMALKTQEQKLTKQLHALDNKKTESKKTQRPSVTAEDIARVVSTRFHDMDVEQLLADEWTQLHTLEKKLKRAIVGQNDAVSEVIQSLRRSQLRPEDDRPVTSLLFVGPSGVGKTAMAKTIASALYHDPKALIKLDMSEFSEGHSVSKILGSPAGYVGHNERNHFIDQVRERPYAVILFDEIDKAHKDVMKLLLQILDEGTLTTSNGKTTSFKHSVIILTSNVNEHIFNAPSFGFGEEHSDTSAKRHEAINAQVHEQLKGIFSPSVLARLDSICLFHPLSQKSMEKIVAKHIKTLSKSLQKKKAIKLDADKQAIRELAKAASKPSLGARQVDKIVNNVIHELLLKELDNDTSSKHLRLLQNKEGRYALTPVK